MSHNRPTIIALGEGNMNHNHPPLYGSFVLGGIYIILQLSVCLSATGGHRKWT